MTVVIFYPSDSDNPISQADISLNNPSFGLLWPNQSLSTENAQPEPLNITKILCGSGNISFSHFKSGCLFLEQSVQINQITIDQISESKEALILLDKYEPELNWTTEKPLLIRGIFIPEVPHQIDTSSYYAFRSWLGQLAKDLAASGRASLLKVNCSLSKTTNFSQIRKQTAEYYSGSEKPLVSVIIPSFDRKNFLLRAVSSLQSQSLKNFEALIVTNEELSFEDPRFKTIKVSNKLPVSEARNTALTKACGKFIAYLDDDDFYLPDHLALLSDSLTKSGNKFAFSICARLWEQDCNSGLLACDRPFQNPTSWAELLTGNRFPTPAVMHVNDSSLKFDPSLECMEDWDLWLRASKGSQIDFIPQVTAIFSSRPNKTSISSSKKLLFHWYAYPIWAKHLNQNFPKDVAEYFINHLRQHTLQILAAFENEPSDKKADLLPANISSIQTAITTLHTSGFLTSEISNKLLGLLEIQQRSSEKPDVSVIVPLYNGLAYTQELWQSVLKTPTNLNVEYIFVDNCSKDGSREWLKSLGNQITAILNDSNKNFAGACNQGAYAAKADLLVFLNNDTIVTPGWLEELIKPILQDASVGMTGNMQIFPDTQRIHHAGIYFDLTKHPKHYLEGVHYQDPRVNFIRECKAVTGACFAIRKADFLKLEGFYEEFKNGYEDVDLCLRLLKLNKKILYTPKSLIYHHVSKSAGRTDSNQGNWQLFVQRCYPQINPDLKDFIAQNNR